MKTEILKPTKENIKIAASSIKKGELVGMPTETVYGLAANALNPDSVKNIYSVKGRPSNNPLIVHIADFNELDKICYINDDAIRLAKVFWPGPLTILQYKKDIIPDAVTGSLNTVAIRMPSNKIARDLISMSGLPIAAPSANKSGRPSPTLPEHVYKDFNGLIPYIIDGGQCEIGLESTVINVASKPYTVLRPGKISIEEIRQILPDVMLSNNILHEPSPDTVPESPGMMYKHYALNGIVKIISLKFKIYHLILSTSIMLKAAARIIRFIIASPIPPRSATSLYTVSIPISSRLLSKANNLCASSSRCSELPIFIKLLSG